MNATTAVPGSVPSLAFITHPLFAWHDPGAAAGMLPVGPSIQPHPHLESAESKQRIESLLAVDGLLDATSRPRPVPASDEALLAVHTPAHLAHVERLAALGGGEAGLYAPMGYHSARAARLAAGAAMTAVDTSFDGGPRRAYCLVRPPGHHAEAERAMAFCLYNNIAVAVRHAQRRGLRRIAVVDWDVHHGNGLESVFAEDPSVLTVSVHQDGLFPPASGRARDRGRGAGEGFNLNVPLPPGSGDGAYKAAFEELVIPAIDAFAPECVFVAAGFDAGAFDPMGRQLLHSETFRAMTRRLLEVADRHAGGRLIAVHEGGYNPWHMPFLVRAVITELMGLPPLPDPFLAQLESLPGQRLTADQRRALDLVARELDRRAVPV